MTSLCVWDRYLLIKTAVIISQAELKHYTFYSFKHFIYSHVLSYLHIPKTYVTLHIIGITSCQ